MIYATALDAILIHFPTRAFDCAAPLFLCAVLGSGVIIADRVAVSMTPGAWL